MFLFRNEKDKGGGGDREWGEREGEGWKKKGEDREEEE